MKRTEVDIVDVHVTSISERVDAFTQYPLLDGTKKYTVEITEFVCPLAGQDALPSQTNLVDNLLFEIRRKYVSNPATAVNHVFTCHAPQSHSTKPRSEHISPLRAVHPRQS